MSNLLDQESQIFSQYTQSVFDGHTSVSYMLPYAAKRFGEKSALEQEMQKLYTYEEWFSAVRKCAAQLYARGVRQHDRVLIYSYNSYKYYIVYYAIWHIGAVAVPLNVYLHKNEMDGVLTDAKCVLHIYASELETQFIQAIEPLNFSSDAYVPIDALLNGMEIHTEKPALFHSDDTALILYTSGTTGKPKGVVLSSKNVVTNVLQAVTRFHSTVGLSSDERMLSLLPLFHVFSQNACMWLPVLLGATVIVVPRIERRMIREGLLQKPTLFFGFPALYGLLILMRDAPLDSVRLFFSGADALSDKIRAGFALLYGRKICSGYGLTEASPIVAVNVANDEVQTNNVGPFLYGLDYDLRDDAGNSVDDDTVGTLWIRGDNVMQGYFNDPEQTAKVLDADGWLNTGDLATVRLDGSLVLHGRSKDLIISKGFNIYPQEVENTLLQHPAVIKSAVIGRDDVEFGQLPIGFVSLREGYSVTEYELRMHCRKHIASYKVPRTIHVLDDLPMTATGKIDKKKLGTE